MSTGLVKEESKSIENKLLLSLRYCKGATKNSMFSIIIPSYDSIDEAVKSIKSLQTFHCSNDTVCYDLDDEADKQYTNKVYSECMDFIKKIKFQDEDKKYMGLIIYYGYIECLDEAPKKIFHTFPIPKDCVLMEMTNGQRFNLGYLNKNPWFTEEFGFIK